MKFSIRSALIIGFLGLIWGTYAITTSTTFISSQRVLRDHARDIMENIAELAMEQSQNHLAHAHGAAALTRRLLSAEVVSSNEKYQQTLERYFLDQLAIYPHFAGIYIGKPNGDFFYVSRHTRYAAGGFRTKIIQNENGGRHTQLIWRDEQMRLVADEIDPEDTYDPRQRPWYQKALKQRSIVWTDPYVFFTSRKPGITIAGPAYDGSGTLKGIVGVDIEIDQLSVFIGNLKIGKNGRAFMINNNGDVVAFSEMEKMQTGDSTATGPIRLAQIEEIDDVLSKKAFKAVNLQKRDDGRFQLNAPRFARFEHNGRQHHAMLTPFSIEQWPWIVGVHLPEDDYLGSLKQNRQFNILLTLGISAVATVLALLLAASIIRPIANLAREALAVKNDDLDTRFAIESRYTEIQDTANSFIRMKYAIRESQEKYRGIFENIQDVYYETAMDGKILEISPSVEKITPYTRDGLIGKNVSEFYITPESRSKMIDTVTQDGRLSDYEIVLKDPEGHPIYYSLNSTLTTDEDGVPVKIIGSMRDITGRKKAEQQLTTYREQLEDLVAERTADLETTNQQLLEEIEQRRQTESALSRSEEKYRDILESIDEGYLETDLRGNLTFTNNAVSRTLGRSHDELHGMNFKKLVERSSRRPLWQMVAGILREDRVSGPILVKIICKGGSRRFIELSGSALRHADGQIGGFRCVGRDVTERLKAELERKELEAHLQQTQRMEAIGTLAGGVAHDFNNLLMGIQGNTTLLLMSLSAADPCYQNVKSIEQCVHSGANLTRQLLGYARGGKYMVKPSDVSDIVDKTSSLFGRTHKKTRIVSQLAADVWSVNIDRSQIEQVLVNLYLNAWQAMDGAGTLFLRTENVHLEEAFVKKHQARPGKYVRITVQDTGSGIRASIRNRVFEPFFTTKPMGRGTGLGLASAFGIIKNHDGIICFDSEPGNGTTFSIYLPAVDAPATVEKPAEEQWTAGHETVLVVDDEPYILDACEAMLTGMGYRVLTAGSGADAVEVFSNRNEPIDLVILDVVMPEMDGRETFRRLQKIDPEVKVVLSSGYSLEDMAEEMLSMGCESFIQKPFDQHQISRKIRELLGK
ncbi:MAG: oxidoreductase [Deltaproteobacteria bacterium SG8_13]|nr:MAG: oxidoreductase [Deltaproteobacteria bacterium SG8_13]